MPRHKDVNWNLNEGTPNGKGSTIHNTQNVQSALLMDIRDELKEINTSLRCLRCINFLNIPRKLDAIVKQTKKRKYVRKQLVS